MSPNLMLILLLALIWGAVTVTRCVIASRDAAQERDARVRTAVEETQRFQIVTQAIADRQRHE